MKTKHLCLTRDSKGEILVEDIFDSEGSILMSKNTTINEYAFDNLLKKKVKQVSIYPSIEKDSNILGSKTALDYKETIIRMKEIKTGISFQI